jgi:hypothetical protein
MHKHSEVFNNNNLTHTTVAEIENGIIIIIILL